MTLYVLLASLLVHFFIFVLSEKDDKIFQGLLLFSNLYFCLGGYYYWLIVQKTLFVGVYWGDTRLGEVILLLSICTTLIAIMVFLLSRRVKKYIPFVLNNNVRQIPHSLWFLLGLAFLGTLIVYVNGIFGNGYETGGYFLIAYQFSDLFVPILVFLVAVRGINKINIALITYFLLYAILVGFRYKIALLAIPLIVLLLFSGIRRSKKILLVSAFILITLILFSLLTLFRSKFSGINIDRSFDDIWLDLQYGLFAESNILFGLISIINEYVDRDNFYYLQPLFDIVKEFIPRFLMPDRETGAYLRQMQLGFLTDQGELSGTAYPFIGEFAMMFGWWGIGLGLILFVSIYIYLKRILRKVALSEELWFGGLGLIAAIMAYYHYSRGYLPQIAKSYAFVLLPYVYFCGQQKRKFVQLKLKKIKLKNLKLNQS